AMYNTALRIVKNTAEAEDVMQESFITAFTKLDSFRGTASFGSWLKRIVINNSIVQYRKSQRFVEVPEENFTEELDDSSEVDSEDYGQIKSQQLLSCMNLLNDSYKNVLTLHFIEGFDYQEICDILDISYANCRTLVSRAKESLRKKLITVSV
ncbi:MAG: RNA polymerase sigma factor, partial [Bacteroidota bacterium]